MTCEEEVDALGTVKKVNARKKKGRTDEWMDGKDCERKERKEEGGPEMREGIRQI